MLDFSPEVLWEYGKLVFLSVLIGIAIGFGYTYIARKVLKKKDVRKEFRSFLLQFVLMCLILSVLSVMTVLGKAPFEMFLFAAFTELVRFLAIPWTASMVVAWKYISPWKLLRPGYYKEGEL